MSVDLTERELEGISVIDVTSNLKFGSSYLNLQQYLSSTILRGQTKIVLNLEHIRDLDIFTVGMLRLLAEECQRKGGSWYC